MEYHDKILAINFSDLTNRDEDYILINGKQIIEQPIVYSCYRPLHNIDN